MIHQNNLNDGASVYAAENHTVVPLLVATLSNMVRNLTHF